ncbi:hypothetical protein CICLE_v10024577mg [Citrus x clementina]|uniref:Uncharacterized protein n=1 Tax=Citrus clementina TaxID=85681 RepID=V4U2A0_CITCL|nr:hypothetical protein CICLE_v10024577mg [Citrus x clementina]
MLGLRPCAKHNEAADVRENKASLHAGWGVAATSGLMGSTRDMCEAAHKWSEGIARTQMRARHVHADGQRASVRSGQHARKKRTKQHARAQNMPGSKHAHANG